MEYHIVFPEAFACHPFWLFQRSYLHFWVVVLVSPGVFSVLPSKSVFEIGVFGSA